MLFDIIQSLLGNEWRMSRTVTRLSQLAPKDCAIMLRPQGRQRVDTTQEGAMSTTAVRSNSATSNVSAARVDMKFEIVVIPVSDVDRAKKFYQSLGWRLDAEFASGDD